MKAELLTLGMQVRHPDYGAGTVKVIHEHSAEIQFLDGRRTVHPETSGLEPAESQAALTGLHLPLTQLISQTVDSTLQRLGLERPDGAVRELAKRWKGGRMVLHPTDPTLQTKEVELQLFFHKLVMMRNNLRVLEQKVNSHEGLTSAEKFDWQQYITRCYGSMTTFNVLFQDKENQF
ncbi:MAG: hypothetical protein EXS36_02965 [Pedosphaera sp.]|nr:hypothetical protein [Pedosphaera sp.]